MSTRPLPLPIGRAIAHGVAACGIVALVALVWTWPPGARDSAFALATVAIIGAFAWCGATLVRRSTFRAPSPANDNDPVAMWLPPFDGQPVVDPADYMTAMQDMAAR